MSGVYAPCEDCGGEVAVGLYSEIRVDAVDEDGNLILKDGKPVKVTLRLPKHVLPANMRSTPLITAAMREAARLRAEQG